MKLSDAEKEVMKLIIRSPDRGDGWRRVSQTLWNPVVVAFGKKELLEIDEENRRVRFSPSGEIVVTYLVE